MANTNFKHLKVGDNVSAGQWNRLVDTVSNLTRSLAAFGNTNSAGQVTIRRQAGSGGSGTGNWKLFEVQTAATGDGVYNCYAQTLDATEWADTAGDDKLDNLNTTGIEVWNTYESDTLATYAPALAIGDRMLAWKILDDESTSRWCGIPLVTTPRWARTTAAAGAGTTIACNLLDIAGNEITSGLGSGITVSFHSTGSANTNAAIPRFANDDYLAVVNPAGTWLYVGGTLQITEDCVCTTPE